MDASAPSGGNLDSSWTVVPPRVVVDPLRFHCHNLRHEDNEMMRSIKINSARTRARATDTGGTIRPEYFREGSGEMQLCPRPTRCNCIPHMAPSAR